MGASSVYVTAVLAGAMTVGIGAANIVALPEAAESSHSTVSDADLAAITIPILDIDQTVGPFTFVRLLELTLGTGANTIFGKLDSRAENSWDFPLLGTSLSRDVENHINLFATRNPGQSIDFGFTRSGPVTSDWTLLGLAGGSTDLQRNRALGLSVLTGGTEGLGAALGGTLSEGSFSRTLQVLNSGFTSNFARTVGDFGGQLSVIPFNGLKAVGDATLLDTGGAVDLKLGSLQVGGDGQAKLGGDAGLCLGSAQGTSKCNGNLAFGSVDVPVSFGLHTGSSPDFFSVDLPNNLAVAVGEGSFRVNGDVGGTVKVGSVEIGRVIPIDFQFPNGSALLSTTSSKQTQSVRNSFVAAPPKLGSDNGTGSSGRHALDAVNTAVSNVKTAVNKTLNTKPRHAKPDSED
jgi:hypothetical protein